MFNVSALVTNAIISQKKFGTLRHGLKPLYGHSVGCDWEQQVFSLDMGELTWTLPDVDSELSLKNNLSVVTVMAFICPRGKQSQSTAWLCPRQRTAVTTTLSWGKCVPPLFVFYKQNKMS
jgi:hypothetical protein